MASARLRRPNERLRPGRGRARRSWFKMCRCRTARTQMPAATRRSAPRTPVDGASGAVEKFSWWNCRCSLPGSTPWSRVGGSMRRSGETAKQWRVRSVVWQPRPLRPASRPAPACDASPSKAVTASAEFAAAFTHVGAAPCVAPAEYVGPLPEPTAFVVSLNLRCRHLDESSARWSRSSWRPPSMAARRPSPSCANWRTCLATSRYRSAECGPPHARGSTKATSAPSAGRWGGWPRLQLRQASTCHGRYDRKFASACGGARSGFATAFAQPGRACFERAGVCRRLHADT
jgi:hypothetical protein